MRATPSDRPGSRRKRWPPLAALGVLVVLGHVVVLDGLYGLRQPHSLLAEMAAPMYTRVLMPSADNVATPSGANTSDRPSPPGRMQSRAVAPPAHAASAPMTTASAAEPAPARPARPPRSAPQTVVASASAATGMDSDDSPAADRPAPDGAIDNARAAGAVAQAASPSDAASTAQANAHAPASNAEDGGARHAQALAPPAAPASGAQTANARTDTGAGHGGASANPGDAWPPNTRLSYKLGGNYRGELHGTARVLWQKTSNRYQAVVELDLGLLASMRLTSQGDITAQSLVPRVYEEMLRKKRRNVRLGDDSLHLANGETVPRPAGVQDTASQFIELSHRFASGQVPLAVGQTVRFALVRPNRVAQWTYDVVEDTQLNLPQLGPTRALLVRPRPADGETQNVGAQMWLAPSLQYLPVRIVLSMGNGEQQVDLLLEKIDQGDKPSP